MSTVSEAMSIMDKKKLPEDCRNSPMALACTVLSGAQVPVIGLFPRPQLQACGAACRLHERGHTHQGREGLGIALR